MLSKIFFLVSLFFSLQSLNFDFKLQSPGKNKKTLFTVKITLSAHEFVYYDSLNLSSNHPDTTINKWEINKQPTEEFDKKLKKIKKILKKSFIISGTLTNKIGKNTDAALVLSYLTNTMDAPAYKFFNLNKNQEPTETPVEEIKVQPHQEEKTLESKTPITCPAPHKQKKSLSDYLQNLIALTSSFWLRLLLVLFLGVLMSLTPCIYPMIPITIGLLQAHAKRSVWYNIGVAISYTLGLAIMFAILGLTAAFTGSLFGKFMSKPIVVVAIICVLLYFAFSMFGLYEIRLPRFLISQKQQTLRPTGSFISAFLFGFISGTIASPCLTPGLAFLLTFIAHQANHFVGFALMFAFGVGMSIPLMLIGTFSTVLKFAPQTGTWMLEIKKIFGIILIALAFYYLSNIVSLTFLLWVLATTLLGFGTYYLLTFCYYTHHFMRYSALTLSIGLLLGAGALYFAAIQKTLNPPQPRQLIAWQTNYSKAIECAKNTKQYVVVDFGAPYCSICKAIDHCIFNDPLIGSIINKMVPVQIDASNSPEYEALAKKYALFGIPTILIIKPQEEKVIHRWGAELYSMTKEEISANLNKLLAEK